MQTDHPPLPEGFQLEHYRIERQLSQGGFSIVYLARDDGGKHVAIKEYLPAGLARRAADAAGVAVDLPEGVSALAAREALLRHGVILRPIGDTTIALCPPLVIDDDDLDTILAALRAVLS